MDEKIAILINRSLIVVTVFVLFALTWGFSANWWKYGQIRPYFIPTITIGK